MIATFPVRMFSTAIIAIVFCLLGLPLRAQGYVDPGAGAMLWQILAASFVGAVFLFRRLVLRWLRRSKNNAPNRGAHREPDSDR